MMTTADRIALVCDEVKQMLLDKNAAYGDSVSDPLRIFSKADKLEAIRVRVDDKLSRIQRGTGYPGDNDVRDLVGYLLLYLANDGTTQGNAAPDADLNVLYRDKDGDKWFLGLSGRFHMQGSTNMRPRSYSELVNTFGPLTSVEG